MSVDIENVDANVELGSFDREMSTNIVNAKREGRLILGLNCCAKFLDRGLADVCYLSKKCDSKEYVGLIKALASENKCRIIEVPDHEKIGEYSGLGKVDATGTLRKKVKSSCAVILKRKEGEDSAEEVEYTPYVTEE